MSDILSGKRSFSSSVLVFHSHFLLKKKEPLLIWISVTSAPSMNANAFTAVHCILLFVVSIVRNRDMSWPEEMSSLANNRSLREKLNLGMEKSNINLNRTPELAPWTNAACFR